MSLESKVTAAVRANSRPSTAALVVAVMEAIARMVPLNTEPVPRVAELPTCQIMLAAWAPPLRITCRPTVVVRVEPIWKMNTAFSSPCASRVRSPEEISSEVVDLYRPGARVWPPRFPATVIAPLVRPAASLYAVVKSNCAWAAAASATCIVPLTVPGGNPVTAVPGLNPRSPLIVVGPVLVTVEAARTTNVLADPRMTGAGPDVGDLGDLGKLGDLRELGVPAGIGTPMILESSVTAAVRANSRPSTVAPVVTVIEAIARILPLNTELVPSVAELPTCQKTFAAWAPPLKITCRPTVVVRVEPIWKMNTAFASPWASRVRSPEEISSEVVDLYRPGVRVWPPRFPATVIAPLVRPAASLYAVVKSSCARAAAASATCIVPLTVPGGNPVTAVPGLNPRSPLIV